jgi:hypothetical protein
MHRRTTLILIAAVFLSICLWLSVAQPWLWRVTAPRQTVHSLVRLVLPDHDLFIIVLPARIGTAGRLALWEARYNADYIHEIIGIMGTPALSEQPAQAQLQSAARSAAPIPLVPQESLSSL